MNEADDISCANFSHDARRRAAIGYTPDAADDEHNLVVIGLLIGD